jgi:two-component system cell cycle response regulator DivK
MAGELILIVEDNAKNLKLTRDVLQFYGYRTLEAVTGADGLALAGEHLPHLILLDIQLADMDGITVLGQLRAEARTSGLPVVALTAVAMSGDRERFREAGFDGYIAKPLSVRDFPEQVRLYLNPDVASRTT